MSLFRTATPGYVGQSVIARREVDGPNLCDRIGALLRTPTPVYKAKPAVNDDPVDDAPTGDTPTQGPKAQARFDRIE